MKKSPHVIWVCPTSKSFYRTKGEVRSRPGSVIPRLAEEGIRLNILIPHDPTLLPKTRLSSSRTTTHKVRLSQDYEIEITKLTRGAVSPGIFMVKTPPLEPAIMSAVFSKAAIALATQLRKPVDIFHLFDWESALVPLFLELDKTSAKIFRDTRTFLNVRSLKDQGNFSPAILMYLGIPVSLFHPEGIEFFGKVSFLKSGLLFSDGVGLIEGVLPRAATHKNGTGLEGILDSMTFKLRRWASERSLRSHLDAYNELLNAPKAAPLLPRLIERLHKTRDAVQDFIESWGPVPPERYRINTINFMLQSPRKAFAFWEWASDGVGEFGLVLEDRTTGARTLLSRSLESIGDFWVTIEPDHEYVLELVSVKGTGKTSPLLRSRALRSPRVAVSSNREAVFIDVVSRRRIAASSAPLTWEHLTHAISEGGGTSAWEWTPPKEAPPQSVTVAAEQPGSGVPTPNFSSASLSSFNLPTSTGAKSK